MDNKIARELIKMLPEEDRRSAQFATDCADTYNKSEDVLIELCNRLPNADDQFVEIRMNVMAAEIVKLKDDIRKLTALLADK